VRTDQLRPLPDLLRSGAGRPGIAFADHRREVTHAELAARTERLAGHLVDLGVRPGDPVAVLLDGVAGVESLLAAVRAGAIAVLVDSTMDPLPDATVVITDATGASRVSPHTLIVDGPYPGAALDYEMLATTDAVSSARDGVDLDAPAFRCYTAGATGERKAVLSNQRNVLWSALGSYADVLSAKDGLLWTLPLHAEVAHVVAALVSGVSVWLAAGLNSTEQRHALAEQQSTVVAGNAATLASLQRTEASVRFGLLVGSGRVTSQFPLLTVYTLTETAGPVAMSRPGDDRLVPLPGVTARLTDDGELLVRGPMVTTGDDWYHTGDLATRDDLERLTITGRMADQVRVGDEVVRLEQVDAALQSVAGVRDAAIAHGPVAYVVTDHVNAADVFAACRSMLPPAAVPAELYAVRAIPRTATGSPLRRRLPGLPARLLGVAANTHETLFAQHWEPVPPGSATTEDWAVAGPAELTAGLDVPGFVTDNFDTLSDLITSWLTDHDGIRLVLLTHGAVHAGGYAPDPTRAAAWGFGRAQQLRHPSRLVLVDADAVTKELLAEAVASGEDELAIRSGELLRPNYTSLPSSPAGPALSGTVVLVSETPSPDLAQHLTTAHDVRDLVQVIPAEMPTALADHFVNAVVAVNLPGPDVLTLHEATLAHTLTAFVLISTGTDAHATAVAEALVRHRHTLELPAVSVTWTRPGFTELPSSWRPAMLDAAMAVTEPCVVAGLRGTQQAAAVRAALKERVLAAKDHHQAMLDVVHAEVVDVLGKPAFHELDWPTTVRLRTRLCVATGLDLPVTFATDHPTPPQLAEHLLALLGVEEPDPTPVTWREESVAITALDPSSLRARDAAVFTPDRATNPLHRAVLAITAGECTTALVEDETGTLVLEHPTTTHPTLALLTLTEDSTIDISTITKAVKNKRSIPSVVVTTQATPTVVPWLLSAHSARELREEAALLASTVADLDPAEVGRALLERPALPHRAAITGTTRAELLTGLKELAAGTRPSTVVRPGRMAYLFTGQGAQRIGMGAELSATFPVFARAFDEACEALAPYLASPLNEVLNTDALHDTEFAQPALFAIEVALFRLLESWGARPDYVAGHSVGELTAAHVSGVWTLNDAARMVAARGRLMQALPTRGAMVAVEATEPEVTPLLSPRMAIAAINGPTSLVLSGEAGPTLAAAEELADRGRKTKRLTVSHAFHSPLMDPMLPQYQAIAETVPHHEPQIPLISALTGDVTTPTPSYWAPQARSTVRFTAAIAALTARGVRTFVELGPAATLTRMTRKCVPPTHTTIPTLTTKHPETSTITKAFGHLFTIGSTVDGQALFPTTPLIPLPEHRRSA
jgi:malonyl CoA-acyl carrier protein transacylase/acyl-CoA synthetase (AMP-forming)/AMP-acid ligase II